MKEVSEVKEVKEVIRTVPNERGPDKSGPRSFGGMDTYFLPLMLSNSTSKTRVLLPGMSAPAPCSP